MFVFIFVVLRAGHWKRQAQRAWKLLRAELLEGVQGGEGEEEMETADPAAAMEHETAEPEAGEEEDGEVEEIEMADPAVAPEEAAAELAEADQEVAEGRVEVGPPAPLGEAALDMLRCRGLSCTLQTHCTAPF